MIYSHLIYSCIIRPTQSHDEESPVFPGCTSQCGHCVQIPLTMCLKWKGSAVIYQCVAAV